MEQGVGMAEGQGRLDPRPLDFLQANRQMPTHADTLQPANLPSVEKISNSKLTLTLTQTQTTKTHSLDFLHSNRQMPTML